MDICKAGGFSYDDDTYYIGGWNSKGEKHGCGHFKLSDSTRYEGTFQNGFFEGLGTIIFSDGARYEGEFMQGWFHGHGVFWRADGMKYEGEFYGGRPQGGGIITLKNSSHGFPINEGFFQDCRLARKKNCFEAIEKARKTAFLAQMQMAEH